MKKCYLIIPLIFLIFNTSYKSIQEDYYYWYKGKQVPLKLKIDKTYLLFSKKPVSILNYNELKFNNSNINKQEKTSVESSKYWAVIKNNEKTSKVNQELIYEAPFFEAENGKELGLTHLFYVKLNKLSDSTILKDISAENKVQIQGQNKFMPLWFTLSCNNSSDGNALDMANKFYESGLFSASEPDLMEDEIIHCSNEPLFSNHGI